MIGHGEALHGSVYLRCWFNGGVVTIRVRSEPLKVGTDAGGEEGSLSACYRAPGPGALCKCCRVGLVVFLESLRSYQQAMEDSIWDAWACVCSSGTHLRERTRSERAIGLMLAIGGLLFYSLLTSTMTAQFKSRMEWLREGAHSEVMEDGHVVICGTNNHLTTVLKQLNKSQELALHDGLTWPRKQTVVLLSEHERKNTEKMVSHVFKDLLQLNILTRSGSLSNTTSFKKVAADKARSIIILASNGNKYEADAESVLTVLALQPLLDKSTGKLVVEVLFLYQFS